ncbi:WLM domain-containing protein [Gilbertella persicaria]|uniref:WLM domain-containing protein n=1 Tax=Gilbertella persicaria TaxID=101096 RepID=UPI002220D3E4|nr:WLM domain-containing protein [Gilbertella persicaria]KAI8087827.1 WLM domain-containing protein [Gilbertella persicaria]
MSTNTIDFKVSFRLKTIPFEQWDLASTIEQVKQYLEQESGLPPDSQKLMFKGRILKDDQATLDQLGIKQGTKLMLTGSLPTQIQQVNQLDKKIEEQKRLAPSIRLKKNQLGQRQAPDPNAKYTFHKMSVIEEFPHPEKAKKLLEKLRDDRGIRAIMADRKWSVGELIELTPFEASILGYNRNAGQLIALRLRTDDLSGFRHYDSIRKVLLHELTHNVWGDHDDNFHALNRQLNKDVIRLDWTAHGAHQLGSGDFYQPLEKQEDIEEAPVYRLGGNSGQLLDTPEARRQKMAAAALSRLTKKEEQEMDEGCGSSL